MKKLITLSLFLFSLTVVGQTASDSIAIDNSGGGVKFYQHYQRLNMQQLLSAVRLNPQAYEMVKKAQGNNTLAAILSYPGGFLIGYPIGTAIAGGKPNWILAGVGAGLVLLAIPVSLSAKKQAIEGAKLYNSSLGDKASVIPKHRPEINVGLTQNGLGIVMRF